MTMNYRLVCTTNELMHKLVGEKCAVTINGNMMTVYGEHKNVGYGFAIKVTKTMYGDNYLVVETEECDYIFEDVNRVFSMYMVCYEPARSTEIMQALGYCKNEMRVYTDLMAACKFCAKIADKARFACVTETMVIDSVITPKWDKIIMEG